MMRLVPIAAVSATASLLAACGSTTESLTLNGGLDVCGLSCPVEAPIKSPSKLPTTAPTNNKGNKTDIKTDSGDVTIALEKSIIINSRDKLAQSKLTYDPVGKTAKLSIDTNTTRNTMWPQPKDMEFYAFGTTADPFTLGGTYEEYRIVSTSAESGTNYDEELQVWSWNNSYATQYRDVTSGGPDADHQAFSFGGTRTKMAAMPTGGTATLTGFFGATAKTNGWENTKDQRQTIDYNNLWRVRGTSTVNADFGASTVKAKLSPKEWEARQTMNGATGWGTNIIDQTLYPGILRDPAVHPNVAVDFLYQDVILQGTITKDPVKGNLVSGRTLFGPTRGYISNSTKNPFAGAFFGPAANEFTGIFNVEAVSPDPIGGKSPINADRRGYVQMGGVVNAQ